MTNFKVVPDNLREREPLTRGRVPKNPLSKALLNGQTVFISGPKQTWGSLYTLAKNHEKKAKTKRTVLNNEEGTLCWFEDAVFEHPQLGTFNLLKVTSPNE